MTVQGRKALTWGILIALLLVGAAILRHTIAQSQLYQSTDNAQVEGDVIPISAEVAGRIVRLPVSDNQQVKAGDLLVEIDPSDYQARLTQAEKALNSARQRHLAARAQLALTRRQSEALVGEQQSGLAVAQSQVDTALSGVSGAQQQYNEALAACRTAQANLARSRTTVEVAQAELRRVEDDLHRYQALYARDEVSRQQVQALETQSSQARSRLQAARREVQAAQAQVQQAEAVSRQAAAGIQSRQSMVEEARSRVGEAQARLVSAQSAPDKIAVAEAQVKVLEAEVEQARAALQLAQQDLKRTRIVAPREGIISKRSAQLGSFAQRGTPLMAVVAIRPLWVVANFKETQMTRMRPGLKVRVEIDSYPGQPLEAHVESLQAGTGARFSLLPPENASGNYVKVVQRVPVKIVFDQDIPQQTPLLPGMSCQVKVTL